MTSGAYSLAAAGAVEGILDEAVLRRLASDVGIQMGAVFGRSGKPYLQARIAGYNQAARFSPWIVLVDLDNDFECAPSLREAWLPTPAKYMYLRVAVREIESWLLADRSGVAAFLGVPMRTVPSAVDDLDDPKGTLVELARNSRWRAIREDIVPRSGSGVSVGPAYTSRLAEFVATQTGRGWRPRTAAESSPSLSRCIRALTALRNTAQSANSE